MKKGLLIISLILLIICLTMYATTDTIKLLEYAKLIGISSLGTFLVGAVYPAY